MCVLGGSAGWTGEEQRAAAVLGQEEGPSSRGWAVAAGAAAAAGEGGRPA